MKGHWEVRVFLIPVSVPLLGGYTSSTAVKRGRLRGRFLLLLDSSQLQHPNILTPHVRIVGCPYTPCVRIVKRPCKPCVRIVRSLCTPCVRIARCPCTPRVRIAKCPCTPYVRTALLGGSLQAWWFAWHLQGLWLRKGVLGWLTLAWLLCSCPSPLPIPSCPLISSRAQLVCLFLGPNPIGSHTLGFSQPASDFCSLGLSRFGAL